MEQATMEVPFDFRGADIDITAISGRNDDYRIVELEFKKPISVRLHLRDKIDDPKFFENIEDDPYWAIDRSEYTDGSWGDSLEECLDAFYADFSFERMLMEEGHAHHAQSLIDQIEKYEKEVYDPSSFIEKDKIGWMIKAKEWFNAKIWHVYGFYFEKIEFTFRSVTAMVGTEIMTVPVKGDLFAIIESKMNGKQKEWHYAISNNKHGVSSGGKAGSIKQAIEDALVEYGIEFN